MIFPLTKHIIFNVSCVYDSSHYELTKYANGNLFLKKHGVHDESPASKVPGHGAEIVPLQPIVSMQLCTRLHNYMNNTPVLYSEPNTALSVLSMQQHAIYHTTNILLYSLNLNQCSLYRTCSWLWSAWRVLAG